MGAFLLFLLLAAIGAHLLVTLGAAALRARLGREPMGWPAYWTCALIGLQGFNAFMLDRWDPQVAASVGGASLVLGVLALRRPDRAMVRALLALLGTAGAVAAVLYARSCSRENAQILAVQIDMAIGYGRIEELRSLRKERRLDLDANDGHAWCQALDSIQPAVLDYFTGLGTPARSACGKLAMAAARGDAAPFDGRDRAALEAAAYAGWRDHPGVARAISAQAGADGRRMMMFWAFRSAWNARRTDFPRRFAEEAGLLGPSGTLDANYLMGGSLSFLDLVLFRPGGDEADYTRWVLGHFDPSDVLVAAAAEAQLDRVREWLAKPGIDLNRRSYCGVTALGAAMQSPGYRPDPAKPPTNDVELALLARGANPDALTGTRYCDTSKPAARRESYTPLSLAATVVSGNPRIEQVARALLKAGANPDLAPPGGLSFRQAAARSREAWVRQLLSELKDR
jgi:hypothetical protein